MTSSIPLSTRCEAESAVSFIASVTLTVSAAMPVWRSSACSPMRSHESPTSFVPSAHRSLNVFGASTVIGVKSISSIETPITLARPLNERMMPLMPSVNIRDMKLMPSTSGTLIASHIAKKPCLSGAQTILPNSVRMPTMPPLPEVPKAKVVTTPSAAWKIPPILPRNSSAKLALLNSSDNTFKAVFLNPTIKVSASRNMTSMPPKDLINSFVWDTAGIRKSDTIFDTIGRNVSPTESPNSLIAEDNIFIAPSNDPRRVFAMSSATPPDSLILSSSLVNASTPCARRALIARAPSVPKILKDCLVDTDFSSSCVIILDIGSILPLVSINVNPSFSASFAASLLGETIERSAELSDEPPMPPCKPAFANRPSETVVSSNDIPAADAVGPTILNASPNCPTSVLALREVCASLSTTPSRSPAFIPIPDRMLLDMSAAAPSSMPAADARLSVAGNASMI